MNKIKLFSFIVFCIFTGNINAQNTLTEEQKVQFQERVRQKVEEFQNSLSKLANNELRHDIRKENVVNLLKLFIGEGEQYDYYDIELDRRVHNTGVKMQTSSTNRTYTKSQLLKKYIYKLYNPENGRSSMPYSHIEIESASAVRVDNIQRVGDHYECVAYFYQKFIGFSGTGESRRWAYSDITSKKIRCYINSIELPSGNIIWDAKLGDIYVLSTERLFK